MSSIELRDYNDYFVGVDLGQVSDYTAIAILEEPVWLTKAWAFDLAANMTGWVSPADLVPYQVQRARAFGQNYGRPPRPPLNLRHLERVRHLGYPAIVDRIAELLARPPLSTSRVQLLVDHGQVGRAVVDQMTQLGLRPIGVTVTGGDQVSRAPNRIDLRVPKREMVVATQLVLQAGRLNIAAGLPDAQTLVDELLAFRAKISANGHDTYDGRSGVHDDLVFAASVAVWYRGWFMYHFDLADTQREQQATVAAEQQEAQERRRQRARRA